MYKLVGSLSFFLVTMTSTADDAVFNSKTSLLTIPQTQVDGIPVYNAKLLFKGNNTFELQSYDTAPAVNEDIPPPGNGAAVTQWLAKGIYKNWTCETAKHPGRTDSPHGTVRVCSNPILMASTSGAYPVGAASVKELYEGSNITGYSLSVKVKAGTGRGNWYWYERFGDFVATDSLDAGVCENCHSGADNTAATGGRDRVFIRVMP
jgi:hypothetical protein